MFIVPHKTPTSLKGLLWIVAICSFITPILTFLFLRYKVSGTPSFWLALSWLGIMKGCFWQLITYSFIHSLSITISLSLLVSISLHLLALWITGSEIAQRFGIKAFWLFYLSSIVICALSALLIMFLLLPHSFLIGSTAPLFALLTAWSLCYPNLELGIFFVLRIKIKWLVFIIIALSLLMHLSTGNLVLFAAEITGVVWGYLIGHLIWKLPHPFRGR